MDKHKLSISFSSEYEELYNHLKKMKNRSSFICKALNENLNISSNYSSDLEEIVERAVIKALSRNGSVSEAVKEVKQSDVSNEDRELINSLF